VIEVECPVCHAPMRNQKTKGEAKRLFFICDGHAMVWVRKAALAETNQVEVLTDSNILELGGKDSGIDLKEHGRETHREAGDSRREPSELERLLKV